MLICSDPQDCTNYNRNDRIYDEFALKWHCTDECSCTDYEQDIENIATHDISDCDSAFPFRAAVTDVTSSGSEVPSATIVSPINRSLIPKYRAIADAPLTAKSLPLQRAHHRSP